MRDKMKTKINPVQKEKKYIITEAIKQAVIQFLAQPCPHISGAPYLNLWNTVQTLPELGAQDQEKTIPGKAKSEG